MERVFPIRCTIFEDSPNLMNDKGKHEVQQQQILLVESPRSKRSETSASRKTQTPSFDLPKVDKENSPRWPPPVSMEKVLEVPLSQLPQLVYTQRAEYAYTDQQGHGAVSREQDHFTKCEDEPIRIPGAIQSHGMLIGLEVMQGENPKYLCRVVSENCEAICKYTPRVIFGLNDFLLVLPAHQRLVFRSQADSIITAFKKTGAYAEPKVFSMSFFDSNVYIIPTWCAMHFLGGDHQLLICEFELQESLGFNHISLDDLPSTPYNSIDSDPLDASSSFASKSEPLGVASDVAAMFHGDGQTMAVVNIMSQIQQQLTAKDVVEDLLDAAVGIVQELTGFHRCMVYRFDEEYNGSVVAELINPQACTDVYRGLHFPASDIPAQARELYKINKVRVLFDRERDASRLICRNVSDLEHPLDLTHSYLRAMSPVHLKYLNNMGVRSTMSISLEYKSELWGLICCHSYGPTATKVPFPVRELCYWLGLCVSNCLDKLLNAEKLKARNALATMQVGISPQTCASASSKDLLRVFQADFGFLVVQGEARTIGKLSSYREAVTLLRYVYFRNFATPFGTKNVSREFAGLVQDQEFEHIAGLLIIPLSQIAGDFIVLFRKEQTKKIHWAGNPQMANIGPLEPRNSFLKWTETVKGTCKPWSEEQFEAAAMTRLVYGNFIRVWREKEAALHESRMKRLLLKNLSHEVRTPLNAVVNYLEMALEKPLNKEIRSLLTQSYAASKSLVYVIDDLLHLTGANRQAIASAIHVAFDLPEHVQILLDQLQSHAFQKSLSFHIIKDVNLPRFVTGDLSRFQQSVTTLISNAIKNTEKGGILVHLGARSFTDETCVVQVAVQDTGKGITERELDDLFQDFEQVPDEDSDEDESPVQERKMPLEGGGRDSMLELSLALLARYIKNCGGQIRCQSVPGKGSTFSLDIPMRLAAEEAVKSLSLSPSGGSPDERLEVSGYEPQHRPSSGSMEPSTMAAGLQLHLDRVESQKETTSPGTLCYPKESSADPTQSGGVSMQATPRKEGLGILIADDNPVNLAVLERRLRKMGHEVRKSHDGQHCFHIFQKHCHEIDFILMDIQMPLVDGIQSTVMIRTIESGTQPSAEQAAHHLESLQPSRHGLGGNPTWPATQSANFSSLTAPVSRQPSAPNIPISPPLTNPTPTRLCEDQSEQRASYFPIPPQIGPSSPIYDPIGFPIPLTLEQQQQQRQQTQDQAKPLPEHISYTEIIPETCFAPQRRVPIFAVSASLDQYSQESLEAAGFDGWISKPIDFKKLTNILVGTFNKEARAQTKCKPKDFAGGGWFI